MRNTMNSSRLKLRAVGGMLLILLCTACSKTPSNSELEAAVAGLLGSQCKVAHAENIRLINGVAAGERQYVAKVGFDVVIPADPKAQSLWREYRTLQDKIDQREAQYATEYKALDQKLSEALQVKDAQLQAAIEQAEKAHDDSHHKLRDEYIAMKDDKFNRLGELRKKKDDDVAALTQSFQGHEELKAIIAASGCTSVSLRGTARDLVSKTLAASGETKYEAPRAYYKVFGEGAKQPFTLEINLIKTDNGWKTEL